MSLLSPLQAIDLGRLSEGECHLYFGFTSQQLCHAHPPASISGGPGTGRRAAQDTRKTDQTPLNSVGGPPQKHLAEKTRPCRPGWRRTDSHGTITADAQQHCSPPSMTHPSPSHHWEAYSSSTSTTYRQTGRKDSSSPA